MKPSERNASGEWPIRLRYGAKRQKRLSLPARFDKTEANARYERLCALAEACHHLPVDKAVDLLQEAAVVEATDLPDLFALARESGARENKPKAAARGVTFKDVAEQWLSGELRRQFPRYVREKDASNDQSRLARLYPVIGSIPLNLFTADDADRALKLVEDRSEGTVRQYAQVIRRVLQLAVHPCRLLAQNPLPTGFVPPEGKGRAKSFLYPEEDAQLLSSNAVDFERRWLWAFLAREGLRLSEALALRKADLDLRRGIIRVDSNKTGDPTRSWTLGADVADALRYLLADRCASDLVFRPTWPGKNEADTFRCDLKRAGIDRAELFEDNDVRQPIRVHDLRATFIVLALAAGRSETWIMDRTGHTTSAMLRRYDRSARRTREAGVMQLSPITALLGLHQNPHQELSIVKVVNNSPLVPAVKSRLLESIMKTPSLFTSDVREQYAADAANIIEIGRKSKSTDPYLGAPVVQGNDPVGEALASALRAALFDKDWAVVERLQEALDARLERRPSAPVTPISAARRARKGV